MNRTRPVASVAVVIAAMLLMTLGSLLRGPTWAAAAEPTFTADVAPILMSRCVGCHRPGEIAPMSFVTYDEVRPWAKAIREAVVTRKMPPWQADPAHGKFLNDISLSEQEIDTLVRWVDGGALRGDPAAMPAVPTFPDGWKLGEPDYVIDLETIDVPADGPDIFIDRHVRVSLPEDRWVRAVEVRPGNRQVLHHLVTFLGHIEMSSNGGSRDQRRQGGGSVEPPRILAVWAAGTPPTVFPQGVGHRIAKEQEVTLNLHIHPNGTATSDSSKIAIYFGRGPLENTIHTGLIANPGIAIPPGSTDSEASASYVFAQDSRILSYFPHMHMRGKAMSFRLTYPDGRREMLLSVPRYDFNWQWRYYPEKPVDAPAGTRLDVTAWWDNSSANRNNPDPTKAVEFGEGSDSEMLVGFVDFIAPGPDKPKSLRERVDALLTAHPAPTSYVIDVAAGFVNQAWGLHLPKDGPGTLYIVDRTTILTVTMRDISWRGPDVVVQGKALRGAGATIPIGIRAHVEDSGAISGKIFIGSRASFDAEPKGPALTFTGKHRGAVASGDAR